MTLFPRRKKSPVKINEAPVRPAKGLRLPRVAILAGAAYLVLIAWEGTEAPKALHAHETSLPAATAPLLEPTPPAAEPAPLPYLKAVPADEEPEPGPADRGIASWYGRDFQGRPTASGEPFDMHGLTAAHRTLPFGTPVEVTNPANGKRVVVRINDRGPHTRRRLIDLSYAAARELDIAAAGTAPIELRVLP